MSSGKEGLSDKSEIAFLVYGDNLDECQKFCSLIGRFGFQHGLTPLAAIGPIDRPIYPYRIELPEGGVRRLGLYPCGRYEDWAGNRRPYIGHEDPDIIVCSEPIGDSPPDPVFAAEVNDSIGAGNNAWQRFPRLAQAASKHVPFVYAVPVCDAEVKDGKVHSLRHPNSVIQLAQLILMERYKSPNVTVFLESPWYEDGVRAGRATHGLNGADGEQLFAQAAIGSLLESLHPGSGATTLRRACDLAVGHMLHHISSFVETDFTILRGHPILDDGSRGEVAARWIATIFEDKAIPDNLVFWDWSPDRLRQANRPFRKSMSTASHYRDTMNAGLSGATEALSYKSPPNEVAFIFDTNAFARELKATYPALDPKLLTRLARANPPLLFLPMAGYVQDTGGPAFSRPDKGLAGLVGTLFGSSAHFGERVVLLYSELVPKRWKDMLSAAVSARGGRKETGSNNLWRELANWATVVISDVHGEGAIL